MADRRGGAWLALLVCAGCVDEPLTVVTWNAGLATGFVAGSEERAAPGARAVGELGADVVCLQEVWSPRHVAAFDALEGWPHRWFPEPLPDDRSGVACAPGALDDFVACVDTRCGDACTDELADCVLSSCILDFAGLPEGCQDCVAAQVGGSAADIAGSCAEGDARLGYGGSFGLGLLSKAPLRDVELHAFDSAFLRRGAVHAVARTGLGEVDVWCAHLASDLYPLPYRGAFESWAGENEAHVEALLEVVREASVTGRVVVLADMNTGPAGAETVAELPRSWAHVEASGFYDPFAALDGRCTWCPDNPLRGDGEPMLLDHVLLDGLGEATATRALEQTFPLATCAGEVEVAHSDHYAVRVTIAP